MSGPKLSDALPADAAFAAFCKPVALYQEIDERAQLQPTFLRRNLKYCRPQRSQVPGQGEHVRVKLQPRFTSSGAGGHALTLLAVIGQALREDLRDNTTHEFLPHAAVEAVLQLQGPIEANSFLAGQDAGAEFSIPLPLGLLDALPLARLRIVLLLRHVLPLPHLSGGSSGPQAQLQAGAAAGPAAVREVACAPLLHGGQLFGLMPCGEFVMWGCAPLTALGAQVDQQQQQQHKQLEVITLQPAGMKVSLFAAEAAHAAAWQQRPNYLNQSAQLGQGQGPGKPMQQWLRLEPAPSTHALSPGFAVAGVVTPNDAAEYIADADLQATSSAQGATERCPPFNVRYMTHTSTSYASEVRLHGGCPFCSCYPTTPSGLLQHMAASHDLFDCTWLPPTSSNGSHTPQHTQSPPLSRRDLQQRSVADAAIPAGGSHGALVVRLRQMQLEDDFGDDEGDEGAPFPGQLLAQDKAFVFCSCCCSEPVDTLVVEQDPGSAMEAAGRACRTGAHGTNLRSTAAAATTGIGSGRKHKKKCKSGRHAKGQPRLRNGRILKGCLRKPAGLDQPNSYYHCQTVQLCGTAELHEDFDSTAEVDAVSWRAAQQRSLMQQDPQLTPSEQRFMLLWNDHLRMHPIFSDAGMPRSVLEFARAHAQVLLKDDQLRRCFVLHLMAAWDSGLLDSDGVDTALRASKGLDQLGAAVP